MKLKVTQKVTGFRSDAMRKARVLSTLKRVSQKNLLEKVKGASHEKSPAVNKNGDLRGIHNRQNPPDSEKMRKVRAMRKFYNKQMPKLQCSGCAFSSQCPQYKPGYVCAFIPFLDSHEIKSEADLIFYMQEMAGTSMRRAHLMVLAETLQGGAPSLETSESLALAFNQLKELHETMKESSETSVELDDENGSIIGRLFGGLGRLVEDTRKAEIIDVPSEVMKSRKEFEQRMADEDANFHTELAKEFEKEELKQLAPVT